MTSTFIRRCAGIATAVALTLTPCFVSAPAPGAFAPLGTQQAGAAQLIDRTPQSVDPISLTTQAYTVPTFPSTATVRWSDGSTSQEPVTWGWIDTETSTFANDSYTDEKTVTITSEKIIDDLAATATVTIKPNVALSVDPATTWCVKGNSIGIPGEVTVHNVSNTSSVSVTWGSLSPIKTGIPGTYQVTGTLDKPVIDSQGNTISTAVLKATVLDSYPVSAVTLENPGILPVVKETAWGTYDSTTLNATVTTTDSAYAADDLLYDWSSSDTSVVSLTSFHSEAYLHPLKEGTATITVKVGDLTASTTVTVGPPVISSVDIDHSKNIYTEPGQLPTLPASATVTWTDQTKTQSPITWEAHSSEDFAGGADYSYVRCTGHTTVNGKTYTIYAYVTVDPLPIDHLTGFANSAGFAMGSSISVYAGDPNAKNDPASPLPHFATYVSSNGETGRLYIKWDSTPDASKYESVGSFTVSGTVPGSTYADGSPITVSVTVNVHNITIKNTPAVEIRTNSGSAPTLPSVLRTTWDNGNVSEASVVWNTDPSMWRGSRDSETTQTVTGTLTSQGVTVHPTATVHINQATASSATNVRVTTEAGVIPALPQNVDVRWSNGDVTSQHVYWNNAKPLNPASYATVGTFTVSGVVTGAHTLNDATIPVTATVTVTEKKQTSDESPITMQRLYNPNTGEHFFTGNAEELGQLVAQGWRNESTAWTAPAAGDVVYRLYNPSGSEHHYTMDANEVNTLMGIGWSFEGVGWRSAPANSGVPVYRLYNPNAASNGHHYTTDAAERDQLVSQGWHDEGIAWYGVKDASSTATDGSAK
ncbi:Ig-like domain-containing protein [Pseudoscardovia radai]|uniref:Ig-like domain-containing protein n=1 Tax=Pseudoscardovia radai TaxID=987066 RepID=UPI003991F5ED